MEEIFKQELFVLTRDMVPIHFFRLQQHGSDFVCPLPKNYMAAIQENFDTVNSEIALIQTEINEKAAKEEHPFENILLGYQGEIKENQIPEYFQIGSIYRDKKEGVKKIEIGNGAVLLVRRSGKSYRFSTLDFLKELFEPNIAFRCHNIDYYWQALLAREFCVRYFNLLNRLIFEK
jgi:hypothetical protein